MLSDELGLEPGPELRRLQEAILAHDPAIARVPVAPRRRGNLPAPLDLVRRPGARSCARLAELLREYRLVTLDRPARGRQEPAGAGGGARAGARLRGRRLVCRACPRRAAPPTWPGWSREAVDARDARPARAGGRAPRGCDALLVLDGCEPSSTRRRASPRACSPAVPGCACSRRAGRCCTSPARCGSRSSRSRCRTRRGRCRRLPGGGALRRPGAHGASRASSSPRRRRRSSPRSPAGWTDCRSPSSWPRRASTSSGSRELLSLVERRLAQLHDPPAADEARAALAHARRVELRPAARRREDAARSCSPCTGRRRPALARRRRRRAGARRGDRRLPARRAGRQVHRVGHVPG